MRVYLHFALPKDSLRLENVEAVRDEGNRTVIIINMFGGEPQRFTGVARIAAEFKQEHTS